MPVLLHYIASNFGESSAISNSKNKTICLDDMAAHFGIYRLLRSLTPNEQAAIHLPLHDGTPVLAHVSDSLA